MADENDITQTLEGDEDIMGDSMESMEEQVGMESMEEQVGMESMEEQVGMESMEEQLGMESMEEQVGDEGIDEGNLEPQPVGDVGDDDDNGESKPTQRRVTKKRPISDDQQPNRNKRRAIQSMLTNFCIVLEQHATMFHSRVTGH